MTDTTRLQALKDLREKVETGGDVYGFGAVGTPLLRGYAESAFGGSLDAAKALHEAVLIGFEWLVREDDMHGGFANVMTHDFAWHAEHDGTKKLKNVVDLGAAFHAYSSTPARAWLLAILSALIAMEEAQ